MHTLRREVDKWSVLRVEHDYEATGRAILYPIFTGLSLPEAAMIVNYLNGGSLASPNWSSIERFAVKAN